MVHTVRSTSKPGPDDDESVYYEPDWEPATPSTFYVGEDRSVRRGRGDLGVREASVLHATHVPEDLDGSGDDKEAALAQTPTRSVSRRLPGQLMESSRRLKLPPPSPGNGQPILYEPVRQFNQQQPSFSDGLRNQQSPRSPDRYGSGVAPSAPAGAASAAERAATPPSPSLEPHPPLRPSSLHPPTRDVSSPRQPPLQRQLSGRRLTARLSAPHPTSSNPLRAEANRAGQVSPDLDFESPTRPGALAASWESSPVPGVRGSPPKSADGRTGSSPSPEPRPPGELPPLRFPHHPQQQPAAGRPAGAASAEGQRADEDEERTRFGDGRQEGSFRGQQANSGGVEPEGRARASRGQDPTSEPHSDREPEVRRMESDELRAYEELFDGPSGAQSDAGEMEEEDPGAAHRGQPSKPAQLLQAPIPEPRTAASSSLDFISSSDWALGPSARAGSQPSPHPAPAPLPLPLPPPPLPPPAAVGGGGGISSLAIARSFRSQPLASLPYPPAAHAQPLPPTLPPPPPPLPPPPPQPHHQPQAQPSRTAMPPRLAEDRSRSVNQPAEIPPGLDRSKLLRKIYARYAVSASHNRLSKESDWAEPRMTGSQLQRCVQDMGLMEPAGPLNAMAVGVVFAKCKPPGIRKLSFPDFLRALAAFDQEDGGSGDVWAAAHELGSRMQGKQTAAAPAPAKMKRAPGATAPSRSLSSDQLTAPGAASYYSDQEAGPRLPMVPAGPSAGRISIAGPPTGAALHAAAAAQAAPAGMWLKNGRPDRNYSEPALAIGRGLNPNVAGSFPGPLVRAQQAYEAAVAAAATGVHGPYGPAPGGYAPPRIAFGTPPQAVGFAAQALGADAGLLSDPLLGGAKRPPPVLRSLTGIATLPQGYAILANPGSIPQQQQQQQQQRAQPSVAASFLAPLLPAAAAAAVAAAAAAADGPAVRGPAALPDGLHADTSLLSLMQRVSFLEGQSREHMARHAELRLEVLQRLGDLAALAVPLPAATSTGDDSPAPKPAGAGVGAVAGGTESAIAAASQAAAMARVNEALAMFAERMGACEQSLEAGAAEAAKRGRLEKEVRAQRLELEECRADVKHLEDSSAADVQRLQESLADLVAAAVSSQLEQQLEHRVRAILQSQAFMDQLSKRARVSFAGTDGSSDGGGGGSGSGAELLKRIASLEAALRFAEEGAAATKAAAEAAEARVEALQAALDAAAVAPLATSSLSPAVRRPDDDDARALLAWLEGRVAELAAAAQAQAVKLQQLKGVQQQMQAAAPSAAPAVTAAAVASSEQRVAAAEAAAAAAEEMANRAAATAAAARDRAEAAIMALGTAKNSVDGAGPSLASGLDMPAAAGRDALSSADPAALGDLSSSALSPIHDRLAACEATTADSNKELHLQQSILDAHYQILDEHAEALKRLEAAVEQLQRHQHQHQQQQQQQPQGAGAGGSYVGAGADARPATVGYDDIGALLQGRPLPEEQGRAAAAGGSHPESRAATEQLAAQLESSRQQLLELKAHVEQLTAKVSDLEVRSASRPRTSKSSAYSSSEKGDESYYNDGGDGDSDGEDGVSQVRNLRALSSRVDATAERCDEALTQCRVLKECVSRLAQRSRSGMVGDESGRGSGGGGDDDGVGDGEGVPPAVRELVAASERSLRKDLSMALKEIVQQAHEVSDLQARVSQLEGGRPEAAAGSKPEAPAASGPYVSRAELEDVQAAIEEVSRVVGRIDGATADLTSDMQFAAKDVGRLLVQVKTLQQLYKELAAAMKPS